MTKKCLIIDDGSEIGEVAGNYLTTSDFDIQKAGNCDEALTMCRKTMPDVILLDADTPKMNSLEFLSRLRRTEQGRRPIVLYCAAREDAKRIGLAIWRGASECLVKPFDEDLLDFKLHQVGAI